MTTRKYARTGTGDGASVKPELPVVTLTAVDLSSVEALRRRNTETLGFLAKGVLSHYLDSGGGLGVKTQDNRLVAYLLFARQKNHIRIVHLCVAAEAGGTGYARALVDQLIRVAENHDTGVIKLSCRRDYPAHSMWPKLGFVPLDEKPAKTAEKSLTMWYLATKGQNERDLSHITVSDRRVNAVIDAQIFFDLHESDDDQTMISKGLQADFLDDLLQLYITDEMSVEIDRSGSDKQREDSRRNVHFFPHVDYDREKMNEFASDLERILPTRTESQRSDIGQLAKTAASDVDIFLTMDQGLLGKADNIQTVTGVRVLSPVQIIVQLDEITDPESYIPAPLSGLDLVWKKVDHDDFSDIEIDRFLAPSERKHRFRELLGESLAQPDRWQTDGIWLRGELAAIRAMRIISDSGQIIVKLCRASRGSEYELFTKFVLSSILHDAIRKCVNKILILPHGVAPDAASDLQDLGFVKTSDGFVRLCPSKVISHKSLERMAHDIGFGESNPQEIEKMCSPVVLKESSLDCFMVPIKPGYARGLYDTNLAKDDMFGDERSVLLRWSNVYYRRKSHHLMLEAPARILWYVSAPVSCVVAVSHFDAVECGSPQEIFRKHRRMGVLAWADIYDMCQGTEVRDIMALQFSHTYLFNHPIDLRSLHVLYKEQDVKLVLQSPSRVPKALFFDIFRMGYERR